MSQEPPDQLSQDEQQIIKSCKDTIEEAPIGIFSATPDGRYLTANTALARMHGYRTPEELLESVRDIATQIYVYPEEREKFKQTLENKGEVINYESLFQRPDGNKFWASRNVHAVRDHSGRIIYYQGFVTDITSKKQAEQELNQKNTQLQQLLAEKDRFFSIIAHDLRSPLTGFLGFTSLLAENVDQFSQQELSDVAVEMQKTAENLQDLLENLLQWASIQKGAIQCEPENILLDDAADKSMRLVKASADNKNISIESDIDPGYMVCADRHMLDTVIRNLLSNAVKFTHPGGQIRMSAETKGRECRVHVEDTGTGMDKKTLSGLFVLDRTTSRNGTGGEKGTGLGLLLCKEFVEMQGGKIRADSTPGKGSSFCFTVPLA